MTPFSGTWRSPVAPALERLPRALIEAALVFLVALAFYHWTIVHWDGFIDYDGHYHFKVAEWIAARGALWLDIPWLPFTVLGERGPDHHWLWHLLLIPFTWIADPDQGVIWAAAVNFAGTAAILAFAMRMMGIPVAPVFAVLAVTSAMIMPYRLMMLRAQNIAVVFMLLAIWAIAARRYVLLGALSFLFMQSYHAAVILAPIALIGSALISISEKRFVITPLTAVAAGEVLALLASPWFPANIEYLLFHVLFKESGSTVGNYLSELVGSEWYPPGWRYVLISAWPAHVTLAGALGFLGWRAYRDPSVRPQPETLLALGVALLSLALFIRVIRFAEYYVPMSCLAAGLAVRDAWVPMRREQWGAAILAAWMAAGAAFGVYHTVQVPVKQGDYLKEVGMRLAHVVKPGEVVYNSDWSDFAPLLWYADRVRYINGLDGHYLAFGDAARAGIWLSLNMGAMEEPVYAIEAVFGARLVVVATRHGKLAQQLRESPRIATLVESRDGWLFEIKPQAGDR